MMFVGVRLLTHPVMSNQTRLLLDTVFMLKTGSGPIMG